MPDPATIFDALHKREKYLPHPSGISSLLFSFATTIIHSCFESNRADPNINDASSYLDLSIIYGNNEEELKKVRTYERGHIHPDGKCPAFHSGISRSTLTLATRCDSRLELQIVLDAARCHYACSLILEVND